jgi:acyl-[acyl-carrier-protein]-phospholipid O-acyltransferase/long-chain-fatty-acid--[acyl-carrier-protein] ligase
MKNLYKISGFLTYFLIVFLNASVDLGHKIVLQNTIF